jgi:hypothetical protein
VPAKRPSWQGELRLRGLQGPNQEGILSSEARPLSWGVEGDHGLEGGVWPCRGPLVVGFGNVLGLGDALSAAIALTKGALAGCG